MTDFSVTQDLNFVKQNLDWEKVRRILIVRLRSIGDTVLSTPSLIALRRFLPDARIDILLEDWVAPVLEGFDAVDNILTLAPKDKRSRLKTAWQIRQNRYDVAFNLHGGTTATFFVRASGAKYRVGYRHYQYNFLYTHLLNSPSDFWQQETNHSAEQQLALLGFVGVPVEDKPKSRLIVSEKALASVNEKLSAFRLPPSAFALLHPAAAFESKQWATENFARTAEFLSEKGLQIIAVATKKEREILENLQTNSRVPVHLFDDLSLPEITALASKASLFVGNDSGIAHIAAAVSTPSVVIFGSSNVAHWRPWTDSPHEVLQEKMPCQPCAGYVCTEFEKPECIKRVTVESVCEAISHILES